MQTQYVHLVPTDPDREARERITRRESDDAEVVFCTREEIEYLKDSGEHTLMLTWILFRVDSMILDSKSLDWQMETFTVGRNRGSWGQAHRTSQFATICCLSMDPRQHAAMQSSYRAKETTNTLVSCLCII
jgi:hypothetical protein